MSCHSDVILAVFLPKIISIWYTMNTVIRTTKSNSLEALRPSLIVGYNQLEKSERKKKISPTQVVSLQHTNWHVDRTFYL